MVIYPRSAVLYTDAVLPTLFRKKLTFYCSGPHFETLTPISVPEVPSLQSQPLPEQHLCFFSVKSGNTKCSKFTTLVAGTASLASSTDVVAAGSQRIQRHPDHRCVILLEQHVNVRPDVRSGRQRYHHVLPAALTNRAAPG